MRRRHTLVHESETCNVWLIEWPPGSGLDWHDHGESYAKITVLEGILTNVTRSDWDVVSVSEYLQTGSFYISRRSEHKIFNNEADYALSLHVYTPPLKVEYPESLELGLDKPEV